MMSNIHDLKRYKEALAIYPHLEKILKILSFTEKSLSYFGTYIPVAKILMVIKSERYVLESYKKTYEDIKNTKGLKK